MAMLDFDDDGARLTGRLLSLNRYCFTGVAA